MADIVQIELGSSIVEGELMVQTAVGRGLRVELLRNEHPETGGFFALGNCSMLVHADDEMALREVLGEFGY